MSSVVIGINGTPILFYIAQYDRRNSVTRKGGGGGKHLPAFWTPVSKRINNKKEVHPE